MEERPNKASSFYLQSAKSNFSVSSISSESMLTFDDSIKNQLKLIVKEKKAKLKILQDSIDKRHSQSN